MYEEEILGSDVAVWPSQSGDKIAYLTFNDSNVTPVVLQHFGLDGKNIDGKTNDQGKTKLRYPKVRSLFTLFLTLTNVGTSR